MKLLRLLKNITFLSTLFITLLITINNQNQTTKFKILIWSTPSLSLGNYLAISTGVGYIFSYLVTNSLVKYNKKNIKQELKYRSTKQNNYPNTDKSIKHDIDYEKTLIERDINDPTPTINASFRFISKTNNIDNQLQNNQFKKSNNSDIPNKSDDEYYEQENYTNFNNEINTNLNDWKDDTYENW